MKVKSLAMMAGLGGSLLMGASAQGAFTGISHTIENVNIAGFGDADVIRLYANFDNTADKLNVVFGNQPFPLDFSNDNGSAFYQHINGGNSASGQIPGFIAVFPSLAYDSYLDIGKTLSTQGPDVGFAPGFPPAGWGGDGSLATTNGSWQRTPDDPLSVAGADGQVFFAQITIQRGRRLDTVGNYTTVEDGQSGTNFGIAYNVPAPGALALLGAAGLVGVRRRRRA